MFKLKMMIIFILIFNFSFGYVNIYPSFFYTKLEENKGYETLVLTNTREEEIRYRLYLEEDNLKDVTVKLYPKSITLKPFESKEVKISIESSSDKAIKYTKILVIKEIALPGQKKTVMTMLKLKLSGFSGNYEPNLRLKKIKNNTLEIENIGDRVGIYEVYDSQENFIDSFIIRENEKKELNYENKDNLIFVEKFQGKKFIKRGKGYEN